MKTVGNVEVSIYINQLKRGQYGKIVSSQNQDEIGTIVYMHCYGLIWLNNSGNDGYSGEDIVRYKQSMESRKVVVLPKGTQLEI